MNPHGPTPDDVGRAVYEASLTLREACTDGYISDLQIHRVSAFQLRRLREALIQFGLSPCLLPTDGPQEATGNTPTTEVQPCR